MPCHFPAAYAAVKHAVKNILPYRATFCRMGMGFHPFLKPFPHFCRFCKHRRINNRFVGVFFYYPFFFRFVDTVLFIPCGDGSPSLHQLSDICLTFQDTLHCAFIPAFVFPLFRVKKDVSGFLIHRRRVALFPVQVIRHRRITSRFNKQPENMLYNPRSIFIRHQLPYFLIPSGFIAVGRRPSHIGAFLPP